MDSWKLHHNLESMVCLKHSAAGDYFCHPCKKENQLHFAPCQGIRIFFVCSGRLRADGKLLEEKTVYIPHPSQTLEITALEDSLLLEIYRPDAADTAQLPYLLAYADAPTYREDCKSEKTTSRMLIPARIVPDFAMGSVETAGKDRIAAHTHPDVDQYFFGLAENECILLVDGKEYPFGGNQLVHIPLASSHGVELEEQHICHYLWMDSLLNEDALTYMEEAHKMNGGKG